MSPFDNDDDDARGHPDHLASGWPEPDSRLLNGGMRPAPSFPLNTLGPLARYIGDLAASKGGPPDYLALSLLTTTAGVVGDARAVQIKSGWTEPCVLWGLLVGNPSAGKSQPLTTVIRAVQTLERDVAPDFEEAYRNWQTRAAMAREIEERWKAEIKLAVKSDWPAPPRPHDADAPPEPLQPRILIGNITVERLGLLFKAFPRGLLMLMDEAAAWFGNFGKYGGDGDAAFFLSAYSGIGTVVDRVKEGGSIRPERALLSACVGIQPERLHELLLKGRADDGLVSRFLAVWPDPAPPVWNTPVVDERNLERLLRRLRTLESGADADGKPIPVVLSLSPDAERIFAEWWIITRTKAQRTSGLMGGFLGKAPGVAARLALVIEILTWAATEKLPPEQVSTVSVEAALNLMDGYFVPMAARVYGDAARPVAERTAVTLINAVRERRVLTINKREVYKVWGLPGLTTADHVQAALDVLEDGDCLLRAEPTPSAHVGRPLGVYRVNPRILGPLS